MKRILAMLLVFTLIPISSFAEIKSKDVTITYAYNKDFENDTLGSSPSGVTCWSFKEKIYTDIDENGNKYLKIEEIENESKGCYPEFGCGELENTVIMEFKLTLLAAGDGTLRISMKDAEEGETGVLLIDNKQALGTDKTRGIMPLNVGRTYEIVSVINQTEKKIDVYVDRRKKISDYPITKKDYMPVAKFRFQSYMIGDGIRPLIGIDDVKIYQSDKPVFMHELENKNVIIEKEEGALNTYTATDSEISKYMKNTVALYVNENKIAIDGEVSYLDENNHNITATVINGRTLVPVRFISQAFGASVDWNEGEESVKIYGDKTIEIKLGSAIMLVDGKEYTLDTPAQIIDGRTYVPVRAIAEALGKKVTYDKSGMIVLANRDNFFNMQEDLGIFRSLAGKLIYDVPEVSEVVNAVINKHPDNGHPRIMADKARFDEIKNNIKTDPIAKKWYETLRKTADSYIEKAPPSYYTEGQNTINVNAGVKQRLGGLGMMYQLTGEEKYAKAGVDTMIKLSAFKDWGIQYSGLALAEMMCSFAIGYDWLYDYMTPAERQTIKDAMKKNGFMTVLEDYNNTPRQRSFMWAQAARPDNWQIFCNAGSISMALAVCDEPDLKDIATEVLGNAMEHVKKSVNTFAPDGAWYEGPSYWAYLMIPFAQFVSSLEYAAGSTYGYLDIPGVRETGYYISGVTGPTGIFSFHDSPEGFQTSAAIWYLANKLKDNSIASLEMERRDKLNAAPLFFDLLWYNPFDYVDVNLQKDWYFRDTEVLTTRSDWSDSAVFAGLHAGMVSVYHGHYDMGEFIIDGFGTRYAASLGADSYDGNVAHFYRNRAEGTNTIVVNPDKSGGQHTKGASRIERFESGDDGIIATLDMTSGYPNTLNKAIRGMKTFDNRQRIILQDEIEAKEPSDIYWFMHTAQEMEISSDGKTARVYGKGKDMVARLTCDNDAVFTIMDAKSFETSPSNPATAYSNDAYKKLTIKLEKAVKATITVEFSFVTSGFEERAEKREVKPINDWTLDEPKSEAPKLSDLKINGQTIDGFKPYQYVYEMTIKDGEALPAVTADGDCEISVEYPEDVPGYIIVRSSSKENPDIYSEYIVKVSIELLTPDANGNINLPSGIGKLPVASVWASDHDGNVPENTLDGDLTTSWAAMGGPTIVFDLGDVKEISYIGLAIKQFNNDGRRQIFNLYTSVDGENYTTISTDNYTSGTTLLEELFKIPKTKARYIKIKGKGSTIGSWTNITEAGIYGE